MNPVLVATAVTVVAGAIVAVSSRDARIALIGLALALVAAPLLADPLPAPLPLAARLIAAVLASELLWIAVRATTAAARGSLVGWPAETLAAAAAFVAGMAVSVAASAQTAGGGTDVATGTETTAIILGAAFALAAVSVAPIVLGRDAFRLAIASAILVIAAATLRAGLVGTPPALEQLVLAGAIVGLGMAGATVVGNAFEGGGGPGPASGAGPNDGARRRGSLRARPAGEATVEDDPASDPTRASQGVEPR